jgi:formylmethanofuran dehydrogenase subunit D
MCPCIIRGNCCQEKKLGCVSKVIMSPLTAELKRPHERGKDSIKSEAVTAVTSHEEGGGREDLKKKKEKAMFLQMSPADAEAKGLKEGQRVIAFNQLGEVSFVLRITPNVPSGVVVAEGVWWLEHCPGSRSVNALTSQKLTDQGGGSTFYDNTVDVRMERK